VNGCNLTALANVSWLNC